MDTGNKIRQYRKAAGMTQKQLADAASLSQGAITKYERGAAEIKLENAQRIAAALNVSLYDLLDFSDDDYFGLFMEEARQVFQAAGYQIMFPKDTNEDGQDLYSIIGNGGRYYITHDSLVSIMLSVNQYSRFVIDEYLNTSEALGDV